MTRNKIKLIAQDKNGIFSYHGACKLTIDSKFSKTLKVEPKNKDYPDISALFRWKFIQKKNLLFIFAVNDIQDLVLIFANDEICKKVHDAIYKNRAEDSVEKEELYQRFLIPVFQKCSKPACSNRFKKSIFEWIEKHEENEKKELLKLLKDQKINRQILDVKNIKQELNTVNARKRRYSEMKKNKCGGNAEEEEIVVLIDKKKDVLICEDIAGKDFRRKKKTAIPLDVRIIDDSSFKIVNFKKEIRLSRKLLVFTSSGKTHCYEFYFHPFKQIFSHKCHRSANIIEAVLKLDDDGNDCIELEDKKHICSPLKYDPKKYIEMKILKKPNYEIMENCSTQSKRMLIIFNPEDRSQCYEYYWEATKKKFHCCGCLRKNKMNISTEIMHENTDAEYIRLINDEHICELRKYNPQKFNKINKYVLSPNYEIQTTIRNDGREKKTLIIFYKNDRKLFYSYCYHSVNKIYYCSPCKTKQTAVFAKLSKNSEGEEYVILSNVEHVCSPKTYSTQKIMKQKQINIKKRKSNHPESQIIRLPNYELQRNSKGIPEQKLIVFFREDRSMCYEYKYYGGKFTCMKCIGTAKLHIDSESVEKYILLSKNEHKCKPVKYEAETKIEFMVFNKDDESKPTKLIIFTSSAKELCYEYSFYKGSKSFRCVACFSLKKIVSAKLLENSNGTEYVHFLTTEHICTPKKFNLGKFQPKIITESGFKLCSNQYGKPNSKLIVFDSEKNEYGYEYYFDCKNFFKCSKCEKKKKHVTARLREKENGEKYLELSHIEHICKLTKYDLKKLK